MKTISALAGALALVLCSVPFVAQSDPLPVPTATRSIGAAEEDASTPCPETASTLDVLSDMQGAHFGPYVQRVMMSIRSNWFRLIPEAALNKTGCLVITFILPKDGRPMDMKVERTSGDESLDEAAEKSIEAAEFSPVFPQGFQGDHLALRVHFVYNPSLHSRAVEFARRPPTIVATNEDGPIYAGFGHGITTPKGIYMPNPEYSDKGRRKKIQGTVTMKIVVTAQGTVRDPTIANSLEPSLDQQALKAVKAWKFQPAMKDGVPVATQIAVQMSFHLY